MSAPDAIHQAVDIAWSIADLLGSLFAEAGPRRRQLGATMPSSPLFMQLDTSTGVQFLNQDTTGNLQGLVTACQPAEGALISDTISVPSQGSASPTPVAFASFPDYTKGLLTAAVVDTSQDSWVPLIGLTARSFVTATDVALGPLCSFSLDHETSTVQLVNNDPNNSYQGNFRFSLSVPREVFEVQGVASASGSVSIPLPQPLASTVIDQLDVQLWGPSGAYQSIVNAMAGND